MADQSSGFQTLPKCDLSQCKVLEGEEGRGENGKFIKEGSEGPSIVNHGNNENVAAMGSLEISKELEVDEDGFQTVSKKNKKAFKEPKNQQINFILLYL